jgi:signal transduction histidine kinase/CheY-like chemotaxis protein
MPSEYFPVFSETETVDEGLKKYVAIEKLDYMHKFAKSSTVATVLAPLLCIPLYWANLNSWRFVFWFFLMAVVVVIRILLINAIKKDNIEAGFSYLNWGVGLVTFAWGIGWLVLVPTMDSENYLAYQIISLTVLFVGMVGYCVNWKTFFCFALPLKIPELIFTIIFYKFIVWPIALGSVITFYLALKMGYLFSSSWEKSISLRYRNDSLINQLVAEKDASIAANIAKSEFIATASHDLRQPMQAINIFMELMTPSVLPAREFAIFKKMRTSIDLLNKMFNTLLDISKLDSNSVVAVDKYFDAYDFLFESTEAFHQLASDKGVQWVVRNKEYTVVGDRVLLGQILRNLLSNAIQYTDAGVIEIEISQESGHLVLTVRDTGCGIPEDDLPFIFKEFFRSQHSRTQHDGLGLGLSIVQRIVRIIGGSLTVHSELGKGTEVTVKTNFKVYPKTEMNLNLDVPEHKNSTVSTESVFDKGAFKSKHLALIENDPALQEAYEQFFTDAGFVVHVIPYVEEQLQDKLLNIPKLDFILSDYRLAAKDGVYFIQKIREDFNADIPACILTADTSPAHLVLFRDLKIDVLYKPIEVSRVLEFIAQRLSEYKAEIL